MPWYREVLFVGTICLSQLFTRTYLSTPARITHLRTHKS